MYVHIRRRVHKFGHKCKFTHTLMWVRMQAQMQFPPCPMPPRSYHAKSDGADGSDGSDASDAYDAEGFGRIRHLVRILKFTLNASEASEASEPSETSDLAW